jgi:glycosyltransferase involved in cell wall biosynthesis
MKRTAIVCTGALLLEQGRLARAVASGDELILIAPPALGAALGLGFRWIAEDAECAAPCEQLLDSQRARLALEAEQRTFPLDEIRFAASTGAAWATGLDARAGGALKPARIIVEVEASDAPLARSAALLSLDEQLLHDGKLAALRDATAIEGDPAAIAALEAAGIALAIPEEEPAWSEAAPARITAVIAHKDHGKYLPACLAALRAQTVPLQIVIVDDGSGPDALEVVAEEERRDPNLRVIRQANEGPGAARNRGIEAADTELILIVDADNLVRPEMAARLAEALRRRTWASAATCALRRFYDDGAPLRSLYCGAEISPSTLFVENTAGDACAMHRRDALLEAGGFSPDRTVIEDWDLWMRYAGLGLRTCVVPEVLFDYRVGPSSRSVNMPELKEYSARLGRLYPVLLEASLQAVFHHLTLELTHGKRMLYDRLQAIQQAHRELHAASLRADALEEHLGVFSAELAWLRGQLGESRPRIAALELQLESERTRAEAALQEAASERAIGAVLLERAREMQDLAAGRGLEDPKSREA